MSLQEDIKAHQSELEFVLAFLPIAGQALSIRDLAKALAAHDYEKAAMAATDFLPVGKAFNAIRKNDFISAAGDKLTNKAVKLYGKLVSKGVEPRKAAEVIYKKHKIDVHADPAHNKEFDAKLIKPIGDGDIPSKLSEHVTGIRNNNLYIQHNPNKQGVDSVEGNLVSFNKREPSNSSLHHELTHVGGVQGTGVNPILRNDAYAAYNKAKATRKKVDIKEAEQLMSAHYDDTKRYLKHEGEIVARASELDKALPISTRIEMVKRELPNLVKAHKPTALYELQDAVIKNKGI